MVRHFIVWKSHQFLNILWVVSDYLPQLFDWDWRSLISLHGWLYVFFKMYFFLLDQGIVNISLAVSGTVGVVCSNRINSTSNWDPWCFLITAPNKIFMSTVTFLAGLVLSLFSWVVEHVVNPWLPINSGFSMRGSLVIGVGDTVTSTFCELSFGFFTSQPWQSAQSSCTMSWLKYIKHLWFTKNGIPIMASLLTRQAEKTSFVFAPSSLMGNRSLLWKGSRVYRHFTVF